MSELVMRKLTAQVREEIATAAKDYVEKRVAKENGGPRSALETKAFVEASDKAYNALYSVADRRRMSKLPEGWLPVTTGIRAVFESKRHEGSEVVNLKFSKARPVLYVHHGWNSDAKINGPAAEELAAIVKKDRDDAEAISNAYYRTRQFMANYRTAKQLIEAWPEVLTIMPKGYFEVPAGTAVVVQSADLNRALGITA